jgi:hypothetical protein
MGAWDGFETPENDGPNYVDLEDGESFTGKLVRVEQHVTPAKTFPGQNEDTVSPQLVFDVDGVEWVYTAFQTVIKNEFLTQRPEIGSTLTISRLGKAKGKNYVNFKLKVHTEAPDRDGDASF